MTCAMRLLTAVVAMAILMAGQAPAATAVRLPGWVCTQPDAIFISGFQPQEPRVQLPSSGSGGSHPGEVMRTVTVSGMGARNYYLYVPTSYSATRPLPLVFALHGGAGSPAHAVTSAKAVRTAWRPLAEQQQFIVAAPVASGANGGWTAPPGAPTDYNVFAAVLADVQAAYNIDVSRRIGWGFSAGGHVMHDLVLGPYSSEIYIDTFAAYAVSAGALAAFACSSPASCVNLVASATRTIPLDIHVGSSDPWQPHADYDHSLFLAHGWSLDNTLWFTEFAGGHNYTTAHLAEIWNNLCPFQTLP